MRPAGELPRTVTNDATGREANAGTGGVANADASGGSVTVGDVRGDDTDIAIDASGGTASADASGGDNNVIAGGGQVGDDAAQLVELSTLTLELEGNVVPGKTTTYWVDTDRPAPGAGPAPAGRDDAGCRHHHRRGPHLCHRGGAAGVRLVRPVPKPRGGHALQSLAGDRRRRAAGDHGHQRPGACPFRWVGTGDLPAAAGGTIWCYAESDRVDSNGNIIVEAGVESHVWSFVCGGPRGADRISVVSTGHRPHVDVGCIGTETTL